MSCSITETLATEGGKRVDSRSSVQMYDVCLSARVSKFRTHEVQLKHVSEREASRPVSAWFGREDRRRTRNGTSLPGGCEMCNLQLCGPSYAGFCDVG